MSLGFTLTLQEEHDQRSADNHYIARGQVSRQQSNLNIEAGGFWGSFFDSFRRYEVRIFLIASVAGSAYQE